MIVIPCGRKKANVARPARELYTGSHFRLARDAAISTGQPWVILSAKYGAVDPDTVIDPYDQTVRTVADARRLARLLRGQGAPAPRVTSWCPRRYTDAMRLAGWNVEAPLEVLPDGRMGFQQSFFADIRRGGL